MASKSPISPKDDNTAEDVTTISITPPTSPTAESTNPSKNAFSTLMSASKPSSPSTSDPKPPVRPPTFNGAYALGAYIASPATYPSATVITYTDDFVTVRDLYPKSHIHLLLLPRDATKTLQHPFDALADPTFCAKVQAETRSLKALVAKELKRTLGAASAQERLRDAALDRDEPAPPGRDWSADVVAGVHAGPSMRHLHVHVLSRDSYSPTMRHRKHYNSFHTDFFVDVDAFPLAPARANALKASRAQCLGKDLECWRCGTRFGSKFTALKRHLEDEFEDWKRL